MENNSALTSTWGRNSRTNTICIGNYVVLNQDLSSALAVLTSINYGAQSANHGKQIIILLTAKRNGIDGLCLDTGLQPLEEK